jgi:tRNA 5-methylaminomethyl-2-thiouridine biosynthesis bifunctional protein
VAASPFTVVPAIAALDATGTPHSTEYGDVYHSADSGPGQARHVFLAGNDLPARWAGARVYTIVETGFGLGLNFLATWNAWRAAPARPARLHFVSIEKHPFTRAALTDLHARYPEFAPLAAQLQAAWPAALPGYHRIEFENGGVILTLVLADVADAAPHLRLAADAFYLDGFAPARNPAMWSPRVMKALARLALPGATLATYTTARGVRDALSAAGFACELRPGFGRKRQMLAARFAPRWTPRWTPPAAQAWEERRAMVVGAGLAGAAVAERLAARGWRIDLIERRSAPAMEASGLLAGAFHPLVARDDSVLARLTRAGFLHALARWRALEAAGHGLEGERCGVLQLARSAQEETRMKRTAAALDLPSEYAEYVPRAGTGRHTGCAMSAGGLWFPGGGWMRPATLVAAQLAAASRNGGGLVLHAGREVRALAREGERWIARAEDGTEIASAPVCVLANAHDAARLATLGGPALKRVRGQITRLPAGSCGGLTAVLAGAGYLVPAPEGAIAGASYDLDDADPAPRAAGHAGNLARLKEMLPGLPRVDASTLSGEVAFRCVAVDRLPLIGALPDVPAARAIRAKLSGAQLRDIPRLPGLYGALAYASRGLTWAALGGEIVASLVEGEPLPLEGRLADAIDPARFVMQLARRGRL